MVTNNPHFQIAPDAPRGGGGIGGISGPEIPTDIYMMLGAVALFAVVFAAGMMWYWRKLKRESSPDF